MDAWYEQTDRRPRPMGSHLGSGEILQRFHNPDTLPGHVDGLHPVKEFAKVAVFGAVVSRVIARLFR